MMNSSDLRLSKKLLESLRGTPLSLEERTQQAVVLAKYLLKEAKRNQTISEKRVQIQLKKMMDDPVGKIFATQMTDQSFRSKRPTRVANQIVYLLNKLGVPRFLSLAKGMGLVAFQWLGTWMPHLLVPVAKEMIRKETEGVIVSENKEKLDAHINNRHKEGFQVIINHLGEAILGEKEAEKRLQTYLNDLKDPHIENISIKISSFCSQLNLIAWDCTIDLIASRLRRLYRAAKSHKKPKFVNLDMEEYRDLGLTVTAFQKVLDEPEFRDYCAGIVLQSYIPESFLIQKELTQWATLRVKKGGAPIKIRIVKGANLAMEKLEAILKGWPQAPYLTKQEADANFKRMVTYGCDPQHCHAVQIKIGSHNLFDIAYALVLRSENKVEEFVEFEMLEGMAPAMGRAVKNLAGKLSLYCPVANPNEFQYAVAYLVRRLDENTAPENFLRHFFGLEPETPIWKKQVDAFCDSCVTSLEENCSSRRNQNRQNEPIKPHPSDPFANEPDTDWSVGENRKWSEKILETAKDRFWGFIPLVIAGKEHILEKKSARMDPSNPNREVFFYSNATENQINEALNCSENAKAQWNLTDLLQLSSLLSEVAQLLRARRNILMAAMIADTAKIITEADVEVSEAIDFVEYYRRNVLEWNLLEDIEWKPKGIVLVVPPWNFPCSIPVGGISAALAAGNCVIFKPAPEAILVGYEIAKCFWEAGISQQVLQFVICEDDPVGTRLIQDSRIDTVLLTGGTSTAKSMLKMRPGINLIAETGGKNALIITTLADRELAIRDLVQSAFGHSGQKCSACSLAILEEEVYFDPHFREKLIDATQSIPVGPAWDSTTRIGPLIHFPNEILKRGLTHLEEGEEWLLEPHQDPENPLLWSPGIKLGVKMGNFTQQQELFGPVLGLICAKDLKQAIQIANSTRYGLTSGIHTLDEREYDYWLKHIIAGNCYINRGITGAIVGRQPFGGCKESSFGPGAKAGGPNYVVQLMNPVQKILPINQSPLPPFVALLDRHFGNLIEASDLSIWSASLGNYTFYYDHYFSKDHELSSLIVQDNILRYAPQTELVVRIQSHDSNLDSGRVIAAAILCKTPLKISTDHPDLLISFQAEWWNQIPSISVNKETESQFMERMRQNPVSKVRILSPPSITLERALADLGCVVLRTPVLANGRLELLNYLREISISFDLHRYGNLEDETNLNAKRYS